MPFDGLPIKATELLIVGSDADQEHAGPFRRFCEDIESLKPSLPVIVETISTQSEFVNLIDQVEIRASKGACPIIHIDMHGCENRGLKINSDEYMPWKQLVSLLSAVNQYTYNQMMVVLFSCFGLHSILQPDITKPAPFVLLAAPSEEITTSELNDSVIPFYRELFSNGIDTAWPLLRPSFQLFIPELVFRDELSIRAAKMFKGKSGQQFLEEALSKSLEQRPLEHGPSLRERREAFKNYKAHLAEKETEQLKVYLCGREPCFSVQDAIDSIS